MIFCSGDPNSKTDIIFAFDTKDHQPAKMREAKENRLVLGAE